MIESFDRSIGKPMKLHPKARPVISKLALPTPIQKYFSNCEWDVDLSNNTNPYLGDLSDYPDIKQHQLKKLYLKTLFSLTLSLSIKNPQVRSVKNPHPGVNFFRVVPPFFV